MIKRTKNELLFIVEGGHYSMFISYYDLECLQFKNADFVDTFSKRQQKLIRIFRRNQFVKINTILKVLTFRTINFSPYF